MGLDIRTGELSAAPDAVQPSAPWPGVAGITSVATAPSPADQASTADTVGMQQERYAAGEADAAAAMASAMAAETDRRDDYERDVLPPGSAYGDPLTGMPGIDPPWETPYFPETNPA